MSVLPLGRACLSRRMWCARSNCRREESHTLRATVDTRVCVCSSLSVAPWRTGLRALPLWQSRNCKTHVSAIGPVQRCPHHGP
eukprot:1498907-Prymnesium_polylepis.2